MKVVILGSGRVGAALANLLVEDGHDVTIIDKEERSFFRLGKSEKVKRVVGVGIDLDVLKEAGIESADAFAAVTNGDNTNYMSARLAKEEFKVPTVTARLYDPLRLPLFETAGIATMCSTIFGARSLRNIITKGALGSHILLNGRFIAEEKIIRAPDVGKSFSQVSEQEQGTLVAVFRGKEVVPAAPDATTEVGDVLLLVRRRENQEVSSRCM